MGKRETEEAISDSRAGHVMRVGSVAELLVDLKTDDDSTTRHSMDDELKPFDPAETLTSAEAISTLLAEAETTADPAQIEYARAVAARARAMHGIK